MFRFLLYRLTPPMAVQSLFTLRRHPTPTYWKRYFKLPSEPRTWSWKVFGGWREPYDSVDLRGTVTGRRSDDDEYFYMGGTIHNLEIACRSRLAAEDYKNNMRSELEKCLDEYIAPRCRCKYNWHYKCELHETWRN